MKRVAFIGGGPTAIYTLHALLKCASVPFSVTIFEEQAGLGRGTPYRPGWNDPAMLSNIASIEIPPLEQTLVEWLRELPTTELARLDIEPDKIGDRTFYPRLVLGEFFHSQSIKLLARAKSEGVNITVRTRCKVTDVVNEEDAIVVSARPFSGAPFHEQFDHVVLATGHQWPSSPEARPGYFLSPWPASALAKIAPCDIGIRGTSLTAIDAVVAIAVANGNFVEGDGGALRYEINSGAESLHLTMMSRKGLLPEADFYFPIPYAPLTYCTEKALEQLIREADGNLLNRAFEVFRQELLEADPQYAAKTGLSTASLEEFHDRYFSDRSNNDPFVWAACNLEEAQANYRAEVIVPWRYAILRMHEGIERLVPYFEEHDYDRFSRYFKPVFVDDYATVPHKSIRRLIALHEAGRLDVMAIGEKYRVDSFRTEGGAQVAFNGKIRSFAVFIEAMGQKALPAKDFPFPSLIQQGIIHDYGSPDGPGPTRGIAIDEVYHPISDKIPIDRLFCLSLPFILGRHPFHQGITSSQEMGGTVAERLARALERDRDSETVMSRAV